MGTQDDKRKVPEKAPETLTEFDSGPSHNTKAGWPARSGGAGQVPEDVVEEESMESFPASDAPGHLGHTGKEEPHRPREGEV